MILSAGGEKSKEILVKNGVVELIERLVKEILRGGKKRKRKEKREGGTMSKLLLNPDLFLPFIIHNIHFFFS